MTQSNEDRRERYAPDDSVHQTKPERDWKEIAEDVSKEQDGTKLLELTNRLIAALDNRQSTA